MSKIKLALDVVSDLKSLAESIETLVHAMESNEPNLENEEPTKKKSKAKVLFAKLFDGSFFNLIDAEYLNLQGCRQIS